MLALEVRINPRSGRWLDVTDTFFNTSRPLSFGERKSWRTMKGVENYIAKAMDAYPWLTREDFRINGVEEKRRTPRTEAPTVEIHVGDVFISEWGYSMTLVDFYQVVKVSKTGKSVTVREIGRKVVGGKGGAYGYRVAPVKDAFTGDGMVKRVKADYRSCPMFVVNDCADAYLLEDIDPAEDVRRMVAENPRTSETSLRLLAQDVDERVRKNVAYNPHMPKELLPKLAQDADWEVREAVACNPDTPAETLDMLSHDDFYPIHEELAYNENTPPTALARLARSDWRDVRIAVLKNENTPTDALATLAQDYDEYIRKWATAALKERRG